MEAPKDAPVCAPAGAVVVHHRKPLGAQGNAPRLAWRATDETHNIALCNGLHPKLLRLLIADIAPCAVQDNVY